MPILLLSWPTFSIPVLFSANSKGHFPRTGTIPWQKNPQKKGKRHRKHRRKEKSRLRSCPVAVFSRASGKKARIAQLVEQLAFNQLVLGSSPSPRTFLPGKNFWASTDHLSSIATSSSHSERIAPLMKQSRIINICAKASIGVILLGFLMLYGSLGSLTTASMGTAVNHALPQAVLISSGLISLAICGLAKRED